MKISERFNLPINGHKDIDFIDIDIINDTKLFIDPYVLQAFSNDFHVKANNSIQSFFNEVFKMCKKSDQNRLYELLSHATEPNETNLGMRTISKHGKGSTASELTEMFYDFYKSIRDTTYINNNSINICMYINDFAEDKMSDLITNIIRNLLYEFTIEQCVKWNIPLSKDIMHIGYYWNPKALRWEKLHGQAFLMDNKSYLLVPKIIVRKAYVVNVARYIEQYIFKRLQNQHIANRSDMCHIKKLKNGKYTIKPPTIPELRLKELKNIKNKNYAFNCSSLYKNEEIAFFKEILRKIKNGYGFLPDKELDKIVYKILRVA